MTGAFAPPDTLAVLSRRYADFTVRLPQLKTLLENPDAPITYTQWEAYPALYHRKPLVIAVPEEAPRDPGFVPEPDAKAAQQAHLERLRAIERHADIVFANADQLAARPAVERS